MSCPNPIDAAVLADYWLAALPPGEEEAVEQHLFACDACGDRLRDVVALAEGLRDLAIDGSLRLIVTDTFLQRASQHGLRVREYAPPAGGAVQCTVTAEDDLLVARLAADLSDAPRVDLCICDERGVEQSRLADIPVGAGLHGVVYQESIRAMKDAPSLTMIMRLVAPGDAGTERVIGEYTFNHTRSM